MSDPTAATTSIQVMARMFSLLDTLAQEGHAVSLRIISERTGLHPSTAHRILNDLAVGGFVERSGPGTYRLGIKLLQLGNLVRGRLDVRELAVRPMQDLHRLTGLSAGLHLRQEHDIVCVARTTNERGHIHVARVTGTRTPMVSSAAGRVLLSRQSAAHAQTWANEQGMPADTLQAHIQAIRNDGMALDDEGQSMSRQLATPVLNDTGEVVAALTLQIGPGAPAPETVEAIKNAAQRLSEQLGWCGS